MADVMRKIVIIDDDVGTTIPTKTELELVYEKMKLNHPHIPPYVFDNMYRLDVNEVEDVVSNIPSMLIRNIENHIILLKSTKGHFGIDIQFNSPMLYLTDGDEVRRIAAYQRIKIMGFVLNKCRYTFKDINDAIDQINKATYVIERSKSYYNSTGLYNLLVDDTSPYYTISHVKLGNPSPPQLKWQSPSEFDNYKYLLRSTKETFLADIGAHQLWDAYKSIRLWKNTSILVPPQPKQLLLNQTKMYRNSLIKYTASKLFNKTEGLTDSERDIVQTNVNTIVERYNQIQNNNCQHLSLLTNVLKNTNLVGTNRFPVKDWELLKEIAPRLNSNEMSQCTLCKLDALCPHYYDSLDGKNDKETLLSYTDHTNSDQTSYYCKICGDLLIKNIMISVNKDLGYGGGIIHDPLTQSIYNNVVSIVRLYVKFHKHTDSDLIVRTVVDTITPYIRSEEIRLQQVKTNTSTKIDMTIYMYITIYTYATIIKLISVYPDMISFNVPSFLKKQKVVGGDSTIKINGKQLQFLFKVAISLILVSKRSTMNKITSLTDVDIKKLLILSYKRVMKLQIKQVNVKQDNTIEFVGDSPFYKYIYQICPGKTISDTLNTTDTKLLSSVNSYTNVNNCQNKVVIKDNYFGYDINKYKKYVSDSLTSVLNYLKGGELDHSVIEQESALFIDRNISTYIQYETYFLPPQVYKYNQPSPNKHYCLDGTRHAFNTYIYKLNDKIVEITKTDLRKWVNDPKLNSDFVRMTLVDIKCSNCNKPQSNTTHPDESKLADIVLHNMDKVQFYNFYQVRCPVSNTHMWNGDVCSQCQLTHQNMRNKDDEYYKKYISTFINYKETVIQRKLQSVARDRINTNGGVVWLDNYNQDKLIELDNIKDGNIMKLANMISLSYERVLFIGLSTKYYYQQIESTRFTIPKDIAEQDYILANAKVRVYINMAIVKYTLLKNGNVGIDVDLKEIYNETKATLPNVSVSFYNTKLWKASFTNVDCKNTHRQLIGFLAYIVTQYPVPFVKYVMDKIYTSERLSSKPNRYKKNIIQNKGGIVTENNTEEFDVVQVDQLNKENFDPFNTDDLDYDQSEVYNDL